MGNQNSIVSRYPTPSFVPRHLSDILSNLNIVSKGDSQYGK